MGKETAETLDEFARAKRRAWIGLTVFLIAQAAFLGFVLLELRWWPWKRDVPLLLICPVVFCILALVLAAALSVEATGWNRRAVFARVLAWTAVLSTVLTVCFGPGFLEAQVRARVSRTHFDMLSVARAIEDYFADYGKYPPAAAAKRDSGNGTAASQKTSDAPLSRPGFGHPIPPVVMDRGARMGNVFTDPFAPASGATYRYWTTDAGHQTGWILVSAGPDRDYDIIPDEVYDPSIQRPSRTLHALTYDPTNGTVSNGDIWRVRQ